MISTLDIKIQQLEKGFFTVGSGKEVIFILGSCRVCPMLNYLDKWNSTLGVNRFTIHTLDPFNWSFDPITDAFVDREAIITSMEQHEGLLNMLKSVDWFLHEYFQQFGMFNTNSSKGKTLYNFGLQPKLDVCIPNFHDRFILFSDIYKWIEQVKKEVDSDYKVYGKITPVLQAGIAEIGMKNLQSWYDMCLLSDLPEMADYVKKNIKYKRFWFNINHVSKEFTLEVFRIMNTKYLHLGTNHEFWEEISNTEQNSFTPLTEYDVANYGFEWGEEVVNFAQYNKIGI